MKHITVFRKEAVKFLNVTSGGTYVDLTLGAAGHSSDILVKAEEITLIAFDLDKNAIAEFESKLEQAGFKDSRVSDEVVLLKNKSKSVYLINDNFTKLDDYLADLKIEKIDGVLADLGWSLDQLEEIQGLSYERYDQKLDMRFDDFYQVTAADLLNGLDKRSLKMLFEKYADIRGNTNIKLVNEILNKRRLRKIETVSDLNEIVSRSNTRPKDKKLYAQVYQALRIAVNNELENLEMMLRYSFESLKINGVLSIITFHSIEERLVTNFINAKQEKIQILSEKKPFLFLRPSVADLEANLKSRSAKLWAILKEK
jgi:16S rRNA (cytosine1402-N4)-methyltransferase